MNDSNLICFFSYGRREIIKKSFPNLLENVRKQDRLLVIDQEMKNLDFYLRYRDKIDFLWLTKWNYDIGPVWGYMKHVVLWMEMILPTYAGHRKDDKIRHWYPKYVNIVESDTTGKKGWIDRVLKIFDSKEPIGIASGYNAMEHPVLRKDGDIIIKEVARGQNMVFKTEYFLGLFDNLYNNKGEKMETLGTKSQDWQMSMANKRMGKVVGILDEITHIGEGKGRTKI